MLRDRRRVKHRGLDPHPLPAPLVHPAKHARSVLLSIPHSGRDYPDWLVCLARRGRESLEALEDPLVDRLAWRAIAAGTGAIVARAPRAAIDCNRSEQDIDPSVIEVAIPAKLGERARGGLGIIPGRTIRDGGLWRRPVSAAEYESRLNLAHRPYHRAVGQALEALKTVNGRALLLDCHSMPRRPGGRPEIILGDRHGRSASPGISAAAERIVRAEGFSVMRNVPYAGGWIVERHGRPASEVHALQLEVDRSVYLGTDLRTPGEGFDRVARLFERLVVELGELACEEAVAAE